MKNENKTQLVDISQIENPWGNDEKVKQEVQKAIENLSPNPKPLIARNVANLTNRNLINGFIMNLALTTLLNLIHRK